jgi:hypothetical protein
MSSSNPHTSFPTSVTSESFVVAPKSSTSAQSSSTASFVDRRTLPPTPEAAERRQFGSSHTGLSEAGQELALAIDKYKVENRRRYITCDEMLNVLFSLGYSRG